MNRQMTQQPRRSYSFGRRPKWRQPATSFLKVTEDLQTEKELEIRILFDLLNKFFICEPQARLDDQSSQRHVKWLRRSTKSLAELGCIVVFQLFPGDQLREPDPAIVAREFAAKRQKEVFERELITMLTPVHVENSERLLGVYGPVREHFTAKNRSYPLRRSGSDLLQEALIRDDTNRIISAKIQSRPD
jgi:hypothetical protein